MPTSGEYWPMSSTQILIYHSNADDVHSMCPMSVSSELALSVVCVMTQVTRRCTTRHAVGMRT